MLKRGSLDLNSPNLGRFKSWTSIKALIVDKVKNEYLRRLVVSFMSSFFSSANPQLSQVRVSRSQGMLPNNRTVVGMHLPDAISPSGCRKTFWFMRETNI